MQLLNCSVLSILVFKTGINREKNWKKFTGRDVEISKWCKIPSDKEFFLKKAKFPEMENSKHLMTGLNSFTNITLSVDQLQVLIKRFSIMQVNREKFLIKFPNLVLRILIQVVLAIWTRNHYGLICLDKNLVILKVWNLFFAKLKKKKRKEKLQCTVRCLMEQNWSQQ